MLILQKLSKSSSNTPFHFHCFDMLVFLPTLHSFPFSNSRLIFDPFCQLGNARVNPRLVPTCTALAPADNAGLEPLAALLEAHQGSSRVSLMITAKVSHWDWMGKIASVECLTWHASTPPDRNPLQSILEVTWPSVTTSHTVSLMIFTDAFCSSCAF